MDNFCYPRNENELMISLKTGSDIRRVFIVYGDPFDGSVTPDGWAWEGKRQEITRKKDLPYHTWWQVTVSLPDGVDTALNCTVKMKTMSATVWKTGFTRQMSLLRCAG